MWIITKFKFKSAILKSSNKSILYNYLLLKMFKNLSAKYYQENKERLQEKACERYQNLSKEKKEKKRQYGHDHYKNCLQVEKQKLVEYKKNIIEWEKMFYYYYNKVF